MIKRILWALVKRYRQYRKRRDVAENRAIIERARREAVKRYQEVDDDEH